MSPAVSVDITWTLTTALMVYFMHAGFGFYEAGMCREKNTVDTLSHNLFILALTIAVFWLVGFGLMFGEGNGFAGLSGFAPRLVGGDGAYPGLSPRMVPLATAFAFALSFADTPATLIAGTGAERIRFGAVMTLTVVISGFVFPIVGHWMVGGGWLTTLSTPVFDTGSGTIHLCGGCCALAATLLLGPRTDSTPQEKRQTEKRKAEEKRSNTNAGNLGDTDHAKIPDDAPSSMPLVFLGAFILWLGFFGFNAGFSMHLSNAAGLVIANTALAGSFGSLTGVAGAKLLTGKWRLRTAIVGLLAANVAVTSSTAVIEPWAAATIGGLAGLAAAVCIPARKRLGLGDPTEYLTMNVVGGLMGLLAVGLFASPAIMAEFPFTSPPRAGLLYGGGFSQLLTQLLAAVVIMATVIPTALLACGVLRWFNMLHVDVQEESEGSDSVAHGERAYQQEKSK